MTVYEMDSSRLCYVLSWLEERTVVFSVNAEEHSNSAISNSLDMFVCWIKWTSRRLGTNELIHIDRRKIGRKRVLKVEGWTRGCQK